MMIYSLIKYFLFFREIMDAETSVITTHRDYATEIADIIRSNLAPKLIREKLLDYHENDIAAALAELKKEERSKLYTILSSDILASVLEYADDLHEYLEELNKRRANSRLKTGKEAAAADPSASFGSAAKF